jgi:outer membrane lipoprotein-sorting protein
MFLSTRRLLISITGIAISLAVSCGSTPQVSNTALPPIEKIDGIYPFSVIEPQVYSCKIVETVAGVSRTYFAARNGDQSRLDIDHGLPSQVSVINDGRTIRIDHKTKTYTESAPAAEVPRPGTNATLFRTMLFDLKRAKFEKLGVESNLTKYRATIDGETSSERFVYIDDKIGFPVRMEIISVEGDVRREVMKIEIVDLTTEAASDLFKVPAGFTRAAPR